MTRYSHHSCNHDATTTTTTSSLSYSCSHRPLFLFFLLLLLLSPCFIVASQYHLAATASSSYTLSFEADDTTLTTLWSGSIAPNSSSPSLQPLVFTPSLSPLSSSLLHGGVTTAVASLSSRAGVWATAQHIDTSNHSFIADKDSIYQLSDDLYRVSYYHDRPYVSYFSTQFSCSRTLPAFSFDDRTITCNVFDSLAYITMSNNIMYKSDYIPLYPFNMSMEFFPSSNTSVSDLKTMFLPLFLHYAYTHTAGYNSIQSIVSSNTQRRDQARIAVGFLWLFAALTMFFVCIMSAVFCTWLAPLVAFPYAFALWAFVLLLLTALLSAFVGLAGFLVLLILFLFFCAVVGSTYYCIRNTQRETPSESVEGEKLIQKDHDKELRVPQRAITRKKFSHDEHKDDEQDDKASSDAPAPRMLWNTAPGPLGKYQVTILSWFSMGFLFSFVLCVAIFGIWLVKDYKIWNRNSLPIVHTQSIEVIPQTVAKAIQAVYAFDGLATKLKLDNMFFHVGTEWCGSHYSTYLNMKERRSAIYQDFILKYEIDMSPFDPSNWTEYTSVNQWFARRLKANARPIQSDENVIISPTDSRVTVFNQNPNGVKFWIKGDAFTIEDFLDKRAYSSSFNNGTLMLFRLAPQDYHRFHMPITATVESIYRIEGSFQSVGVDGMTSKNYAIYNQRTVIMFNSSVIGRFAYVAIGALCVGSVQIPHLVGDVIHKGEEVGYFQFGGSTIALLFPPNSIRLEDDIYFHSQYRVESFIYMGSRVATIVGNVTVGNQTFQNDLTPSRR